MKKSPAVNRGVNLNCVASIAQVRYINKDFRFSFDVFDSR